MIDLECAFSAATRTLRNSKSVAAILPNIVQDGRADMAISLISKYRVHYSWLPEALALFLVDGLTTVKKRTMLSSLYPGVLMIEDNDIDRLAEVSAAIGRYAFSFPQWRFAAQGAAGMSLLEHYGMAHLQRPTDVLNPNLPKSDPARDKFGIGFIKYDSEWMLEFRRAYVLCINHTEENRIAVLVRNSSYFFGRDRLPHAAYFCTSPLSSADVKNMDDHGFTYQKFRPLYEVLDREETLDVSEKLRRIEQALLRVDAEDMALSSWLSHEGRIKVEALAATIIARQEDIAKVPFYLAEIDARMPPWFPRRAIPAGEGAADNFGMANPGTKLVLLSGPDGDLPVKPALPLQKQGTAPALIP
jgi:hypothetical protein